MGNKLTKIEKEACLLAFGGIPMTKGWKEPDTEFIRSTPIFQRKLKNLTNPEYKESDEVIITELKGTETRQTLGKVVQVAPTFIETRMERDRKRYPNMGDHAYRPIWMKHYTNQNLQKQ